VTDALAVFRGELRAAAARYAARRRRARRALAASAALTLAVTGAALAAATRDSFRASPAPPAVEENFSLYRPELGFDPVAGAAELVARDGEFSLYRTPSRQGTYCVTWTSADAPRTVGDGGSCVTRAVAEAPFTVGILTNGTRTALVAGRVQALGAARIELTAMDGTLQVRPVGADGFFLAVVPFRLCSERDWATDVVAVTSGGAEVARARFTLVHVEAPRVCGFGSIGLPD
jgi:hypothetical protein